VGSALGSASTTTLRRGVSPDNRRGSPRRAEADPQDDLHDNTVGPS
jgi:hypothetical protein